MEEPYLEETGSLQSTSPFPLLLPAHNIVVVSVSVALECFTLRLVAAMEDNRLLCVCPLGLLARDPQSPFGGHRLS